MNRLILMSAMLALGATVQAQQVPSNVNSRSAHLRVYRPRRFAGSALAPSIYVDDVQVARVGDGRRISIKLSTGAHSIRSDDKSSGISLQADPGQEYFVRVDEVLGFWKGHGKLTLLLPEQGAAEYKLQKPVEDDRRIAKNLIEDDAVSLEQASAPTPTEPTPIPDSSVPATPQVVKVVFTSTPDGADIEIDGRFVGNTPSSVEVEVGEHSVAIKKAGYDVWTRKLTVRGGDIRLSADLEKRKDPSQ